MINRGGRHRFITQEPTPTLTPSVLSARADRAPFCCCKRIVLKAMASDDCSWRPYCLGGLPRSYGSFSAGCQTPGSFGPLLQYCCTSVLSFLTTLLFLTPILLPSLNVSPSSVLSSPPPPPIFSLSLSLSFVFFSAPLEFDSCEK